MSKPDGGPAFPFMMTEGVYEHDSSTGMTLREWHKSQALASGRWPKALDGEPLLIADWCGKQADAMIEERDR